MGTRKLTDCVVLIDNDTINGFYNAQLISRLGIAKNVKVTSDASEAVEFIRQCCMSEEGEYNSMLIFLDLYATTFNGKEFLSLVNNMTRKIFEKVEFIILTPSLQNVVVPKEKEQNILGVIEKPLNIEKLQMVLDKTDKGPSIAS